MPANILTSSLSFDLIKLSSRAQVCVTLHCLSDVTWPQLKEECLNEHVECHQGLKACLLTSLLLRLWSHFHAWIIVRLCVFVCFWSWVSWILIWWHMADCIWEGRSHESKCENVQCPCAVYYWSSPVRLCSCALLSLRVRETTSRYYFIKHSCFCSTLFLCKQQWSFDLFCTM